MKKKKELSQIESDSEAFEDFMMLSILVVVSAICLWMGGVIVYELFFK